MSDAPFKVLIVDDDEDDFIIARDTFAEIKGQRFSLTWKSDYGSALEAALKDSFDICFFDYNLGAKNGLELLQEAKENGCKTPIILLTGQGDREIDMEAMRRGAADYLVKGKYDANLIERSIRYAIAQTKMLNALKDSENHLKATNESLQKTMELISSEMNMASQLQRSMLPNNLGNIKGVRLAAQYIPCESIGGDLYDLIEIDEDNVAVLILDVMGHGVPSALVTALAKFAFSRNIKKGRRPKEVMTRVNREIRDTLTSEFYLTAFLGILDKSKKEFVYTRAGHPLPMLVRKNATAVELLTSAGMPIALIEDINFDEQKVALASGDKIFMYTDGIVESQNTQKQIFGKVRLETALLQNRDKPLNEILAAVESEQKAFSGPQPRNDDITMMLIEIN